MDILKLRSMQMHYHLRLRQLPHFLHVGSGIAHHWANMGSREQHVDPQIYVI
jgi:hypothetical protein